MRFKKRPKYKYRIDLDGWLFWLLLIISLFILGAAIFYFLYCSTSRNSQAAAVEADIENVSVESTGSAPVALETKQEKIEYFGDSFSSSVFVNSDETNFFLDDNVTAYIFKPVYSLENIEVSGASRDILSAAEIMRERTKEKRICLYNSCLSLNGKELFFNGKKIGLPAELENLARENKLASLSLGNLESTWLLGAVIGGESDKYGLVYYFDGKEFESLISQESAVKIEPKYDRSGGMISFGGQDSDFIVLYSGYNGIAYRIRGDIGQESFTDLSGFFGLRVTDQGFESQIVKVGQGNKTSWFVCGRNNSSFKLIKLWQNGTEDIIGAVDLGNIIFNASRVDASFPRLNLDFSNLSLVCFSEPKAENRLVLSFFPALPPGSAQTIEPSLLTRLSDQGFDNSHDYKIISTDLNNTKKIVRAVNVKDFNCSGDCQLEVSNNKIDWYPVKKKKTVYFSDENSRSLYWRLQAEKSNNSQYSPYFDHINALEYYLVD